MSTSTSKSEYEYEYEYRKYVLKYNSSTSMKYYISGKIADTLLAVADTVLSNSVLQ